MMGGFSRCVSLTATRKSIFWLVVAFSISLPAQQSSSRASGTGIVRSEDFSRDVTSFLGKELAAHVADISSFDPPQPTVVGVPTTGEFSWGTFLRAVASYSELSGDRRLAGRDVPQLIGKCALIEARHDGKAFAQMYAAIALRSFGTNLKTNPVWQSLTPQEQSEWRSLLDPGRFYDRKTRHVINLPENYFGVAARVAAMDYQLGIISDRVFVDDVLDRAAEQFTAGALYSDDNIPTGRYDRYSNEYARYVYEAAEAVDRQDLMRALEPTLRTQMRTWWDMLSPDGYGYPWGRSLVVISYIDTIEIVGFLSRYPQFRPAPLGDLATADYVAWQSLMKRYRPDRHLLDVLGFGYGNYSYINPEREWQQTTAFFGKAAGAHKSFTEALRREHVVSFPREPQFSAVARFEYFRKTPRMAGVWLVRQKGISFALPITTGTKPGISDYLPAPYDFPGFAPPVEQQLPTVTPYIELTDGITIVAGDGADEIYPSQDGHNLRAVWRHWAQVGGKPGQRVDVGLTTEVTWSFKGDTLTREEKISAAHPISIKRFWVAIPSTATVGIPSADPGRRSYTLQGAGEELEVSLEQSSFPTRVWLLATGNSAMGRGSRGPVPLILNVEARDLTASPGNELTWSLSLRNLPGDQEPLRVGADEVR
jgi:hypothetical protein